MHLGGSEFKLLGLGQIVSALVFRVTGSSGQAYGINMPARHSRDERREPYKVIYT